MPPPRFIDNEAKEGVVTSEDEDLDEFNTNEVEPHDVAKIDEPTASPPTLYLVVVPSAIVEHQSERDASECGCQQHVHQLINEVRPSTEI